jgi:hypothetical protein
MWHEFEERANDVRQTLIGLAERSPVVVSLADMCGLHVWQLVAMYVDHLPPSEWRLVVEEWNVDVMHNVLAHLIMWSQEQHTTGADDLFSNDDEREFL